MSLSASIADDIFGFFTFANVRSQTTTVKKSYVIWTRMSALTGGIERLEYSDDGPLSVTYSG